MNFPERCVTETNCHFKTNFITLKNVLKTLKKSVDAQDNKDS